MANTSIWWVSHCLVVGSEYIVCSTEASSNNTLALFSTNFAFRILCCVWVSMFIQEMKTAKKRKKEKEKRKKSKRAKFCVWWVDRGGLGPSCSEPSVYLEATLLWKALHYPKDIDFRSNHTPYFALLHLSLPDCCWQWIHRTSKCHFFQQNSDFVLSKLCILHHLRCLDFHIHLWKSRRKKKKSKSTKNSI